MGGVPFQKRRGFPVKRYLKGLEIIVISNYYDALEEKVRQIQVTCAKEGCPNMMCYYSNTGRPREDRIRVFCRKHGGDVL